MVKKVIANPDSSKVSSSNFIPVVVLKVFRAKGLECGGKGLQLKTATLLVFFLWLVKSLKNL